MKSNKGKGKSGYLANDGEANNRSRRTNRGGGKKTHEISDEVLSADGMLLSFYHKDDKKNFINVPVCSICRGHHPRGGMTMRECDGHIEIMPRLRPSFAR